MKFVKVTTWLAAWTYTGVSPFMQKLDCGDDGSLVSQLFSNNVPVPYVELQPFVDCVVVTSDPNRS